MVQGNHFLGCLRSAVLRADKFSEETKDLVLWKDFLVVAHTGIDLNLLTTREPNNILRTDACEHGLGGYSLKTGQAWHWEIYLHLRGRKSINFLEILACVVGILLSIVEDDPAAGYCYLSVTDKTSAMGWLRKSNFVSDGDHAAHLGLAREFTSEFLRRALILALCEAVFDPVKTHVHSFGAALLDCVNDEAQCACIVGLDGCGSLRVSKFDQCDAERSRIFCVMKKCAGFGFSEWPRTEQISWWMSKHEWLR